MNDHISQRFRETSGGRYDLELRQQSHQSDTKDGLVCDSMLANSHFQQHAALPSVLNNHATPQYFPNSGIVPLRAAQIPSGHYVPDGYLGAASSLQLTASSPSSPWPGMAYNAHQQMPLNDSTDAHAYKTSSSPEAADNHGDLGKPHRRGYQACQNCRSRKVKCDLGSE